MKEVVENWVKGVAADFKVERPNDSWPDRLEYEFKQTERNINFKLISDNYVYWLDKGRKPTSPTGPYKQGKKLKDIILERIESGKMSNNSSYSNKSLAYLIAKHIHENGFKGSFFVDKVLNESRINSLVEQIGNKIVVDTKVQILNIWQ